MDRRHFLSTAAAAAALPLIASAPKKAWALAQTGASAGDAALNAVFDRIFQDQVRRSPGFATSLGLDKGENAHLKSELDVRPAAAARAEELAIDRRDLAAVRAIDPATLSPSGQLNRDVVIYQLETSTVAPGRFFDVVPPRIGATVMGAFLLFIHLAGDAIAFPLVGALSDRFGIQNAVMLLPVVAILGGLVTLLASRTVAFDMGRAASRPTGNFPALP